MLRRKGLKSRAELLRQFIKLCRVQKNSLMVFPLQSAKTLHHLMKPILCQLRSSRKKSFSMQSITGTGYSNLHTSLTEKRTAILYIPTSSCKYMLLNVVVFTVHLSNTSTTHTHLSEIPRQHSQFPSCRKDSGSYNPNKPVNTEYTQ